jgi:predicted nucleotide-binding protein
MPYHVRITLNSDPGHDEVKLDLTEEQLRDRILTPYEQGRPIVIGGRTLPPDDIQRLRITETEQASESLIPTVRAEQRASGMITMTSDEWYVAEKGRDVTDDFIKGPPGSGVSKSAGNPGPEIRGPRVVFVVHGRNLAAWDALFTFLRSIGLHPLEWSEAILADGSGAPYIGAILEKAFEIAQAVVVLMTPDDEARLRKAFHQTGDGLHETRITPQARPNVLFEAGMAMGRSADRTIIIEMGNLRPFSDIAGRHVVRLNNTSQRRQELAQRLQAAGCPVNLTGTDWHKAGDFEAAIRQAPANKSVSSGVRSVRFRFGKP